MSAGQHPNGFRAFVRRLPDEIAKANERGQPIVFPVELLPADREAAMAARRLLASLGVTVVEELPGLPETPASRAVARALERETDAGDALALAARAWLVRRRRARYRAA